MNKIILGNGKINNKIIDDCIKFSYESNDALLSVNNLKIDIIKDTILEIDYNTTDSLKLNVFINVGEEVNVEILEKYQNGSLKIKSTYEIGMNSQVYISKYYDVLDIKQFDTINLNKENANINYVLKTVTKNLEKYNLLINHNASNTSSNIINNAVNIENGSVIFDINGIVPKGKIGCNLNQNNRIVTFNHNKCQINPNLLIDETDVSANHSAFVGKFNDADLFYLQSRGITNKEAIKLLVKGFLINGLITNEQILNDIDNIISKYWR